MLFSSRDRKVKTVVALALACGLVNSVSALAAGPLEAFLPKDGILKGNIVEPKVAKRDQAISKQFQLAVQNNMDWFKHYVTSNKAGEPLPYNPKMGVTQAQYEQLLHMKADLEEKAPIEITVRRGTDGSLAFASTDPATEALRGTTFPPDQKVPETPFGKLTVVNEIHQQDANAPFGVWNGVEWARVAEDGSDQPSVKVAFGKREPSGEGVFYYQVAPTKEKPEQSLVVVYKLD